MEATPPFEAPANVCFRPIADIPLCADVSRMTVIKRLALSLLAGGVALVAAYWISYRILWFEVASATSGDGQSGMGPVFGGAFIALAAGMITSAVVFHLSRRWL